MKSREECFELYLKNIKKSNSENYTKGTIYDYTLAAKRIAKKINFHLSESSISSIFHISDIATLNSLYTRLTSASTFIEEEERGNSKMSSVFKKYIN